MQSTFNQQLTFCSKTNQLLISAPEKDSKQKVQHSPSAKPVRVGKQRSLSLSEKPIHRIYIRRTVSQEEVSNKDNFAKPNNPDQNACHNKKYLVRMRRHSMNDSILTSTVEKINPYFTKSYTRSPHKVRSDYTKTTYATHSPKRQISVTSFDAEPNHLLKSPPKKNKKLPIEADIFDFKSEPHRIEVIKVEQEDDYNSEELRKTETYSYSLLKGASKTSSVNPCFSSRKTFVKKINSLPSKCVNRFRQEYCSKKGKSSSGCNNTQNQAASDLSYKHFPIGTTGPQRQLPKNKVINAHSASKFKVQNVVKKELVFRKNNVATSSSCGNMSLHVPVSHCQTIHSESQNTSTAQVSPTTSTATSDVTMVTSSSMESLKSTNSSSSAESSKMELLNDLALLSYAIAGNFFSRFVYGSTELPH